MTRACCHSFEIRRVVVHQSWGLGAVERNQRMMNADMHLNERVVPCIPLCSVRILPSWRQVLSYLCSEHSMIRCYSILCIYHTSYAVLHFYKYMYSTVHGGVLRGLRVHTLRSTLSTSSLTVWHLHSTPHKTAIRVGICVCAHVLRIYVRVFENVHKVSGLAVCLPVRLNNINTYVLRYVYVYGVRRTLNCPS